MIDLRRPAPPDSDMERVAAAKDKYLGPDGDERIAAAMPVTAERVANAVLGTPARLSDLNGFDFRRAHRDAEEPRPGAVVGAGVSFREHQMSTHSPGPWKATIGDVGGPNIVSADGRFIADVRTFFIRFLPDKEQRFKLESAGAESAANALLMAASPNLLKACEAVDSACYEDVSQIDFSKLSDALLLVAAAIAEAKGKEPQCPNL